MCRSVKILGIAKVAAYHCSIYFWAQNYRILKFGILGFVFPHFLRIATQTLCGCSPFLGSEQSFMTPLGAWKKSARDWTLAAKNRVLLLNYWHFLIRCWKVNTKIISIHSLSSLIWYYHTILLYSISIDELILVVLCFLWYLFVLYDVIFSTYLDTWRRFAAPISKLVFLVSKVEGKRRKYEAHGLDQHRSKTLWKYISLDG